MTDRQTPATNLFEDNATMEPTGVWIGGEFYPSDPDGDVVLHWTAAGVLTVEEGPMTDRQTPATHPHLHGSDAKPRYPTDGDDPQTPATEAGRLHLDQWHPDTIQYEREWADIIAIEAEARASLNVDVLARVAAMRKPVMHGNWDSGWNAAIDAILAGETP